MGDQTILEREDLLSRLDDLIEHAASGSGAMVLIPGEAGAGKTSLIRALRSHVGDSALFIEGACDPLSTPRPLSPLLDFATDSDAGLEDLMAERDDLVETFNIVLDRLRHSIRTIVMVVEDVHWADQGTLDFLRFIGRRVVDSKAVVICTYRDDEVGADHQLRPVLGQVIPLASTHRLPVPPLSRAAVAKLARNTDLDPTELHRITGGNAFYVTEVIAGGESLPASVQEAVIARVARLDKGSRRVVEAVSIAPRSLEVERAILLASGAAETIDRAIASGAILADGRSLRFRHELARAAVEQSIPPARLYELHSRMLALLQEEGPSDHARLAHHAIQTRQPDLVLEHAPEAARQASKRGAHKEAIAFYEAVVPHAHGDRAAALRVELAKELRVVDRQRDSLEQALLASAHYRETDQPMELAESLSAVAAARWTLNDRPGSRAAVEEAIELLNPLGPSRQLAYARYHSAHLHMLARHAQPAMRDVIAARELAAATGSDDVAWNARMIEGCVHIVAGEAKSGLSILEEVLEDAGRQQSQSQMTTALNMLGSGGGEARLYDKAITYLEQGVEQGLATDADYMVAYSRAWLARVAFEQGRWDEAVGHAELVDRTAPNRIGIAMVTALGALARVRVRRGDPGARELLGDALQSREAYEIQHVWSPICGLAEHHWLTGQPEKMERVLADGYRRALDTDSEWARGEIGYWMWKAGAIDLPPDNAAEPFRLQMEGQWREAARTWEEIGCPYEVALSLSEGDQKGMLEALPILDRLGAGPAGNLVRSSLRDLGVDAIPRAPSRETMANPAGLTNRQLEVLELLSAGNSNAEIAEELFVSKKTVEHHVSAIYSKLGVSSRPKAIAAAMGLGVGGD